jgi:hypothetical protein
VKVCSFLKKRTKKHLFLRQRHEPGHGPDCESGGDIKVFCFFSSEKKGLPVQAVGTWWAEAHPTDCFMWARP